MGKWLSKDPDAYLPDRPRQVQPYPERAREHALRHDGPPYAEEWREVTPRWRFIAGWLVAWGALAYFAAVLAGMAVTVNTFVLAIPIVLLAPSDARRFHGAAIRERRDVPTWLGHPDGAAPWLAVFALHGAVVVGSAVVVASFTADEGAQRVAVLASGFVAGAAGWALDIWWGRRAARLERAPKQPPTYV